MGSSSAEFGGEAVEEVVDAWAVAMSAMSVRSAWVRRGRRGSDVAVPSIWMRSVGDPCGGGGVGVDHGCSSVVVGGCFVPGCFGAGMGKAPVGCLGAKIPSERQGLLHITAAAISVGPIPPDSKRML